MEEERDLINGIWFGNKSTTRDIVSLREAINQATTEEEYVILINELLKLGDFESKSLLFQLLNSAKDEKVINLSIKLLCSVSSHQDLLNSENLLFLANLTEDQTDLFAANAIYTLSYDVIPCLLALLEEWDDTNVEDTIRNSLDIMLDYSTLLGGNAPVEEIGNFYLDFIKEIDSDMYYYFRKPIFPGDLAKELIKKSIISLNNNVNLNTHVIPSLLSIWSGIRCPVGHNTIISDDNYKEVLFYVKKLSTMNWESGKKYFYGNVINEN